jgi:hypothetical protein
MTKISDEAKELERILAFHVRWCCRGSSSARARLEGGVMSKLFVTGDGTFVVLVTTPKTETALGGMEIIVPHFDGEWWYYSVGVITFGELMTGGA